MRLRHKKSKLPCSSFQFNIHTACPQEIIVAYKDGMDSDYITEFDAQMWDGSWKDLRQAFADGDIVIDNLNTMFFLKDSLDERHTRRW